MSRGSVAVAELGLSYRVFPQEIIMMLLALLDFNDIIRFIG